MYPFHKNWAPRMGIAYSPRATSGISKLLFGGPGKTSIRAGAGMYYDLIGQPLAQTFSTTTPGLSQSFSNPANILSSAQVPRYTTFYAVPSAIVPAAAGGRIAIGLSLWGGPVGGVRHHQQHRPAVGRALHNQSGFHPWPRSRPRFLLPDLLRRTSLAPFAGRARLGHANQPCWTQHRAKPTSRQCRTLMTDIDFLGMNPNTLPAIPFFQNMWPGAGGNGLTPTQVWANDYYNNSATGDATNTLNNADNAANCANGGPTTFTSKGAVSNIACGKYGPWMVFNPQFSALSAWSSHREGRLSRAAGDPSQAPQFRTAIRSELHLVEVDRPWLGSGRRRLLLRLHSKHLEPQPAARRFELRYDATVELLRRLRSPVRPRQEVRNQHEQDPRRVRGRLGAFRHLPADFRPPL